MTFLTLTYPPIIDIGLVVTILTIVVDSLIPLLMSTIDIMHSPIHQPNNG